jgi:hypothetical protein
MQNNVIQVTSSSSSTNAAQAQLVHVQPSHQQPGSQIRQMLPPQNAPFRHNVVIQREQKAQQIIRYPSQSNPAMLSSSGKLSPQQEMRKSYSLIMQIEKLLHFLYQMSSNNIFPVFKCHKLPHIP